MATATRNKPAPVVHPPETITLELSLEEASYIRTLIGDAPSGACHVAMGVYTALNGAGVERIAGLSFRITAE